MITIIVCSINKTLLAALAANLDKTLGVEYELLAFDNTRENLGICEVYNTQAQKSRYPYLCFVHEDVLFETANWGQQLINYFQNDSSLGVVGLAGGKYKSEFMSGWYNGCKDTDCCNIWHLEKDGKKRSIILNPDSNQKMQEVVCLDGVFITVRKDIWSQVKWGEDILKGFHFYDIDFSLRASAICKVIVTFDINLIHISQGGDFGNNWVKESLLFHQERKQLMPASTEDLSTANRSISIINTQLDRLKNEKIDFAYRIKWISVQKLLRYPAAWYAIARFLLYRPFRLKKIHNLIKR